MKLQILTTESTEKKSFSYSKNSVNSVSRTSQKEFPLKVRSEDVRGWVKT